MLGGSTRSSTASVETEEQMRERLVKEMFSKDAEALAQLLDTAASTRRKRRAARLEAEAARRRRANKRRAGHHQS